MNLASAFESFSDPSIGSDQKGILTDEYMDVELGRSDQYMEETLRQRDME